MQIQPVTRTRNLTSGLSQIVSMFRTETKTIFQLKSQPIIKQLESLRIATQSNDAALFDFNVYELANLVIAQLRNLLREGFSFKQKDNSLAYALIRMIQINILLHCCQSNEVQKEGGALKKTIEGLIDELRKDAVYCLYYSETNLDEFQLIDGELRNLLRQVVKDKEKYLKETRYQSYSANNSYRALHQIFHSILNMLRSKIKYYLVLAERQTRPTLYFYCDRIYLKLCYLQLATNSQNTEIIQKLASARDQKCQSFIYLLDSPSGLIKLLNYFQQAPTSALINDRRYLKMLFKESNHKEK